jgi:hypothetical protein
MIIFRLLAELELEAFILYLCMDQTTWFIHARGRNHDLCHLDIRICGGTIQIIPT